MNFSKPPGAAHVFNARYVLSPRITLDLESQGRAHSGTVDVDFVNPWNRNTVTNPNWWRQKCISMVQGSKEIAAGQTFTGCGLRVSLDTEGRGNTTSTVTLKRWSRDWTDGDDITEEGWFDEVHWVTEERTPIIDVWRQ